MKSIVKESQGPGFPTGKQPESSDLDMSLLDANLRLSVTERLRRHDAALRTLLALRAAVNTQKAAVRQLKALRERGGGEPREGA